jgi:hypothetical protein
LTGLKESFKDDARRAVQEAAQQASAVLREIIPEGEDGHDPNVVGETLRQEDACQFPLFGSLSLLSLYLTFKFLCKDLVNLLIGGCFGLLGCGALTAALSPLVDMVTPKSFSKKNLGWEKKLEHPLRILPSPLDLGIEFTLTDSICFDLI